LLNLNLVVVQAYIRKDPQAKGHSILYKRTTTKHRSIIKGPSSLYLCKPSLELHGVFQEDSRYSRCSAADGSPCLGCSSKPRQSCPVRSRVVLQIWQLQWTVMWGDVRRLGVECYWGMQCCWWGLLLLLHPKTIHLHRHPPLACSLIHQFLDSR
jgi:hypothetical protein